SFYDPIDGSLNVNPIGVDVAGGYGSLLQLVGDTMLGVYDNIIGSINVTNGNIINASIVDTLITAFVYDTLNQLFYVTQTDYLSWSRGLICNNAGIAIDTFLVGYAPVSLKLIYATNTAPVSVADITNAIGGQTICLYPLDNDTDADGDSLVLS